MREEVDPLETVALLDDECARAILVATSDSPLSANDLDDRIDASLTTIYRRLEELEEAGLVDSRTLPDEDGHHYTVYGARLERLTVEIADGTMRTDVTLREEHVADRFTRLYEQLR